MASHTPWLNPGRSDCLLGFYWRRVGAVFDGGVGMLNRKNQPATYSNFMAQRHNDFELALKKHQRQRANERFMLTVVALTTLFILVKLAGL
jgi:hypothetical protein